MKKNAKSMIRTTKVWNWNTDVVNICCGVELKENE